jgi:DNA-binding NarL/FixJ family response regulator
MTLSEELTRSVLVVDDNRVFADALAMALQGRLSGVRIDVAHTMDEARELVARRQPGLVLLDFRLADACGLDLVPYLKGLPIPPDVIVLSGIDDTEAVIAAVRAGVQGWVTKDESIEVLIAAAHEVRSGRMYLSPSTVGPLVSQLIAHPRDADREDPQVAELSRRELEVLRCLVAGLSRAEIATRLFLSVNTVRTHVRRLLRWADKHSTPALVAHARALGITGIDQEPRPW